MSEWINVENIIIVVFILFGVFCFYKWWSSPVRKQRKLDKEAAKNKKKKKVTRGRPQMSSEPSERPKRPRPEGQRRPSSQAGNRPPQKKKRPPRD